MKWSVKIKKKNLFFLLVQEYFLLRSYISGKKFYNGLFTAT